MAQKQGTCIFCGGTGLTKQHVWQQWIGQIIDRTAVAYRDFDTFAKPRDVAFPEMIKSTKKRQGHMLTDKFRRVCEKCNSGWMSVLEERSKPLMTKLILGEHLTMDNSALRDLATLIAISTIMAEYTSDDYRATSEEDAQFIYAHKQPPPNWHILIGFYLGAEWSPCKYRHVSGEFYPAAEGKREYLGATNLQTSTYVLGNLLCHSISIERSFFDFFVLPPAREVAAASIWPQPPETLNWPPSGYMGDEAAELLSKFMVPAETKEIITRHEMQKLESREIN